MSRTKGTSSNRLAQPVFTYLQDLLSGEFGAHPYGAAMSTALSLLSGGHSTQSEDVPFLALPLLCCVDAGGTIDRAVPVASSWGLLYLAAHLMDSVEDQDSLVELGPGVTPAQAANLATGLYALSVRCLTHGAQHGLDEAILLSTVRDFQETILRMMSSQHEEMVTPELSLQGWWSIAQGKSGSFFALGCRSGASLAERDPGKVDAYSRYGSHLGVMIQIADDAKDVWGEPTSEETASLKIERTMPVLYALSVLEPAQADRLRMEIRDGPWSAPKAENVKKTLEAAGAALYLRTRIEQETAEAMEALDSCPGSSQARSQLVWLLDLVRTAGAG